MILLEKGKLIYINDYKLKKATKGLNKYRRRDEKERDTEEERKKTLNLFIKVLATMKKESYK